MTQLACGSDGNLGNDKEMPAQPDGVNRLGSWGGAMAQAGPNDPADEPNPGDILTAEKLGQRVATIAMKHPSKANH